MNSQPLALFLVRHGQTAWNVAHRFQGQSDVPLDETGAAQAERIGLRLAREKLDAIYASDLARAQSSARAIAAHQICPIHTDTRLRELSFGEWEGLTYAEITTRFPEPLRAWEQDPYRCSPPGGESLAQLAARAAEVLQELRARHAAQTIAIAAHGGPLQVLICLALNHPPEKHWQFGLLPGSLSELIFYPAGAILNRLNETHEER